jgi:hypothetical protein
VLPFEATEVSVIYVPSFALAVPAMVGLFPPSESVQVVDILQILVVAGLPVIIPQLFESVTVRVSWPPVQVVVHAPICQLGVQETVQV